MMQGPPQYNNTIFGFFKINFLFYIVCITWVLVLLITPAIEPAGTIDFGDHGMVGPLENFHSIEGIQNPFSRSVYHSGDSMCHMKNSRSFFINENQMAYCARCFGIFLGLAIGAGIASFVYFDIKWWILVLGIIPIGLDGGLQMVTPYVSNNLFRIVTGSLLGIVTMLIVGIVVVEFSEYYKMKIKMKKFGHKDPSHQNQKLNKTR